MKRIVICADGTWNRPEKNLNKDFPTNVLKFARGISAQQDSTKQVVFYDWGIGSYHDNFAGGALGKGLEKNIKDCYRFLVHNYEIGDEIFLFGFSRGAYTIRSLCGLINNCSIINSSEGNLIDAAFDLYKTKRHKPGSSHSINWRASHAVQDKTMINFVGVWDTVESLVMNAGKKFHDTTLNPDVTFGFHAISIDERRKDFPVCMWNELDSSGPHIEQVWFAGVHSAVGGWYDERGLSNISLQWMLTKAKSCGLDIYDELASTMPGDHNDKIHESYTGFWKFRGSRRRKIPEGSLIHKSVFNRMSNPANKYKPKNLPDDYSIVE